LPPERELALQLGISRRLLRRVLERSEAAGKIWRCHGKGTFVGSKPPPDPGDLWLDRASNPVEVMEARLELEPILAALAAVRATSDDVRHIEWSLARSRSAMDFETFELWDGTLHRAIAQAAHNSLLLALYDMVNTARSRAFWGQLQDAAVKRSGLEAIAQQHHAFVDAILRRDPAEARRWMHAHIAIVRDGMFAREENIRSEVVASAEVS
jgi:DNA-binding FadR family transcriptional regulator